MAATVVAFVASLLISAMAFGQNDRDGGFTGKGDFLRTLREGIAAVYEEKASWTPAQQKMESGLLQRVNEGATESVVVDIHGRVGDELVTWIEQHDGSVIDAHAEYRSIRVRVPLRALESIATLDDVQTIRDGEWSASESESDSETEPESPSPVVSEGDGAHRADEARETYSVDGTGISIAVVFDGVRHLETLQDAGELPHVTVLPGYRGSSGGRAGTLALEVLHDVAPGADLYFATANRGNARYAAVVRSLRQMGVDIIVDGVNVFAEPAFQHGSIARAYKEVADQGAMLFVSTGNEHNLDSGTSGTWEGDYRAGPPIDLGELGWVLGHYFDEDTYANKLTASTARYGAWLKWSDPDYGSNNDYDLFVVNQRGVIKGYSANTQSGTQRPYERISGSIPAGYSFVIKKYRGEARYLRLMAYRGTLTHGTAGAVWGPNALPEAFGIAAVSVGSRDATTDHFSSASTVAGLSSDGPRRIFYENDGTPITPGNLLASGGRVINKPDFAGAHNVSTSMPGLSRYPGTSAAAAHVAGIAALMMEASGGPENITREKMREALIASAIDISSPGHDRNSGHGIVQALDAVREVHQAARNRSPEISAQPGDLVGSVGVDLTEDLANYVSDPDGDELEISVSLEEKSGTITSSLTGTVVTFSSTEKSKARATISFDDPGGFTRYLYFGVSFKPRVDLAVDPGEVSEGTASATVRVTASMVGGDRTEDTGVSVTVGSAGDSAEEGTDYAEIGDLQLNIPANSSSASATFTLRPTDDATVEAEESISVSGAVAGLTVRPTELVIVDDDVAAGPTVAFDGDSVPAGHDGTAFTVRLSFSGEIAGLDTAWVRDNLVTETNGTVTNARRTDAESTVGWELDVEAEPGTADTTLSMAAGLELRDGRTLSAGDSVTVAAWRSLSVADADVGEGAVAAFAVTLDRAAPRAVGVDYETSDGTATAGSDYTGATGTLTFAAGETLKTVDVTTADDDELEGAETFTLTLSAPAGGARLGDASATGTIADDDTGATFDADTVDDVHDGTAFAVDVEFSENIEGMGYAWVRDTLVSATGATVAGARRAAPPSNVRWHLNVEPDAWGSDVALAIEAGTELPDGSTLASGDSARVPGQRALSVAEASAGEGAVAAFSVTLDRSAPGAVEVDYATSDGTATAGSDYTAATATLTFAAGETSKTVEVTVLDDEVAEDEETFTLTLSGASSNARLADATATGTITDDDAAAGVTATFDADTVDDVHDGTAFAVDVEFSEGIEGMGYAWVRDTLVSATGATMASARRAAPPSNVRWHLNVEPDAWGSDVALAIEAGTELPDGSTLASGDSARVPGQRALSVAEASAGEGAVAAFAVTLDRSAPGAVEVDYATSDGTATAGSDYTAAAATLTFAAGETSKTVEVTVLDDEVAEDEETFTLTLSGASSNARLADATATGTITDDDVAAGVTATFDREETADEHDGESAFTARLGFDEDGLSMSHAWVRDTLVSATNADIEYARRVDPPSNTHWNLEIVPESSADVTLAVVEGLALPDGTAVSGGDTVTVRGPVAIGASVDHVWVTLTWGSPRDDFGTPSGSDYAVAVNGEPRAVTSAALSGRTVQLELATPVAPEDVVTVGYVGSAMHPLADATGTVRSSPWDGLAAVNATGADAPGPARFVVAELRPADPVGMAGERVTALDASGAGLAGVSGLVRVTALERLDLSGNSVAELSPLAALRNLRDLDLSGNRIVDPGPLSALYALERLDLSDNAIADAGALAGLPHLRVLLLDGNAVADVGPLTHLARLEHLGLAGNAVADVTALQDLTLLRRLDLSGNPVRDLSPLGDVGTLVWLALPGRTVGGSAETLGRLARLRWTWYPGPAQAVGEQPGTRLP